MRTLFFVLVIFSVFLVGGIAFSQTSTPRLFGVINDKQPIQAKDFQQKREEIKEQIKKMRMEYKKELREKREEMKTKMDELRGQLRESLRERKIDEKKSLIVERIYERINALNERLTNHYLNVLEKLETMLERIESRTAKAKMNGKDVREVELAIEKAHDAINKAILAVKNQAEKIYQPPQITNEENLKLEVGKIRKQLLDDLKAVEKMVKEARDTLRQAAVLLAQIPKVDELEVPTTTTPSN